jgi:hypothetical protein
MPVPDACLPAGRRQAAIGFVNMHTFQLTQFYRENNHITTVSEEYNCLY